MSLPELHLNDVVRRKGDLLTTDVGNELVMMNTERAEYYGLNPVATAIWKELEAPKSIGDLVTALAARFDAPQAVIAADVMKFLEMLRTRDLLDVQP